MLAALLATRPIPVPPILTYGNQLVAAITLFPCIFFAKRAAVLTTNRGSVYIQLVFAWANNESIASNLERMYMAIISQRAADSPAYLSNLIAQSIATMAALNGIVQSLPVAPQNMLVLADIQRRVGVALRQMQALAIFP